MDGPRYIAAASGSMTRANNRGESGHLCLVPLYKENGSDAELLTCNRAVGARYSSFIQVIKAAPKLNVSNAFHKSDHSILSEAIVASNERIAPSPGLGGGS